MSVEISVVKMKDGSEKVKAETPFHPNFPTHAKNLGGKWNSKARAWYFDPRDEASVRDLCRDCFGTDGETEPELVDCQVTLTGSQGQSVWFAGREVARRSGRDWPVKLGEGVVVIEGNFASSGGSAKYPQVMGTGQVVVLEVRDVPVSLARREAEKDNVKILGDLPVEPIAVTVSGDAALLLKKLARDLGNSEEEIVAQALSILECKRNKE